MHLPHHLTYMKRSSTKHMLNARIYENESYSVRYTPSRLRVISKPLVVLETSLTSYGSMNRPLSASVRDSKHKYPLIIQNS
jgi:hypothetical protein